MAAVGQMASGIAHEINNPLTTISACIEFMEGQKTELRGIGLKGKKIIKYVQLIREETDRATGIVSDLLDFSSARSTSVRRFKICEVVRSTVALLRVQNRFSKYELLETIADDLPETEGDRERIRQVVVNLLTNAIEAMPEGGTVSVSLKWDKENAESVLNVSDNGTGIPLEIQDKIFQPFFTTKIEDRGTGLGLSIVHNIVSEHKGSVEVESSPVVGSSFTVRLPLGTRLTSQSI